MPAAWRSVRLSMAARLERARTDHSALTGDPSSCWSYTMSMSVRFSSSYASGEVFSARGASSLLRHPACTHITGNVPKVHACGRGAGMQ